VRARKVYENIEFERGSDPMKSMEIGTNHPAAKKARKRKRYAEMQEDFFKEFADNITFDSYYNQYWSYFYYPKGNGDGGKTFNDRIRMNSGSWMKKKINDWFKKNHPNFRVKNYRLEHTGPYTKDYFLTIEYKDSI